MRKAKVLKGSQEIKPKAAGKTNGLRKIANKLLESKQLESEHLINFGTACFSYRIAEILRGYKLDSSKIMTQMITFGYLVIRSCEPDPESYYVCATQKEGQQLNVILHLVEKERQAV